MLSPSGLRMYSSIGESDNKRIGRNCTAVQSAVNHSMFAGYLLDLQHVSSQVMFTPSG